MEEQKYFIPEIEDIYSGYQYERERNGKWEKVNEFSNDYDYEDNPHYALMKDIEEGKIRVPYLSKEQIRTEGWVADENFDYYFTKSDKDNCDKTLFLQVNYNYFNVPVWITIGYENDLTDDRFSGSCPSINELRYICKLLKI